MTVPSSKPRKTAGTDQGVSSTVEYAGKRTKTGNSTGFRFEGALFKSHPEFSGKVRAHVIAPGRMLVTADAVEERGSDPVIDSFLAFLRQDMVEHPQAIRRLDEDLLREVARLTGGMAVSPEEDLGDEDLL